MKGGIVGVLISIISIPTKWSFIAGTIMYPFNLVVAHLVSIMNIRASLNQALVLMVAATLVESFMVGAIVGYMYGKIKNRKKLST